MATRNLLTTRCIPLLHSSVRADIRSHSCSSSASVKSLLQSSNKHQDTNARSGFSRGFHSLKYAEKCMKKRQKHRDMSQLPDTKGRRLILKLKRVANQGAQKALEGTSCYQSVGHLRDVRLPDPVYRGVFKPVTIQQGKPTFITLDLETTGLIYGGQMPHITQIAAAEMRSGATFDIYVTPQTAITTEAQRITGIVMVDAATMKVNGRAVNHVRIQTAVQKLCDWLEHFDNVVLVAHNGRRFDFPVLTSALCTKSKDRFFNCVLGYIDSLTIFTKMFPKQSHKLEDLANSLLRITYNSHNAIADVGTLRQLLMHIRQSSDKLLSYSFPPKAVTNNLLFNMEKYKNLKSLDPLVSRGICKRTTAENIAGSGLQLGHLKMVFKSAGEDGLRDIFTQKNSEGLPRVTCTKKTLDEMMPKLAEYFSHR